MMDKKGSKLSVALGITFVWFTTQFGGGFASGAQLKSYFIRYGVYCLFTCIGAQAICAVYNAYIAYFARKHGTYDYRSFNKAFYGKSFHHCLKLCISLSCWLCRPLPFRQAVQP